MAANPQNQKTSRGNEPAKSETIHPLSTTYYSPGRVFLSACRPVLKAAMLVVAALFIMQFGLLGFGFLFACYLSVNIALALYHALQFSFYHDMVITVQEFERKKQEEESNERFKKNTAG